MAQKETKAAILSLATLFVGAVASFFAPDSLAFQRSGSLVVIFGILFALREIIPIYREEYESTLDWLESKRAEHDIIPSLEDIRNKAKGTTDYAKQLARQRGEAKVRRAVLIDTAILVAGTLVWGFGDIPFMWLGQ